jgi:hypothetical protein
VNSDVIFRVDFSGINFGLSRDEFLHVAGWVLIDRVLWWERLLRGLRDLGQSKKLKQFRVK